MNNTSPLPSDPAARKNIPIFSGCIKYFPDALLAVAACSKAGNDQHNPGAKLHWDRSKSGDELDALVRHLIDAGTMDTDGIRHSAKVAWRALANLQKEIEEARDEGGESGMAQNVWYCEEGGSDEIEDFVPQFFKHVEGGFGSDSIAIYFPASNDTVTACYLADGDLFENLEDWRASDVVHAVVKGLWEPISEEEALEVMSGQNSFLEEEA